MSIATLFKSPLLSGVGLMLGAGLVIASVASQSPVDALREADARPALEAAQASHAAMLAVAQAGQRLVSVGEHGLILFSEDQGQTWQQATVPVSVTLTSVSFANALQGWAAGHYGLILHTEDGGQSWIVQMDGQRAANLVLKEAEARAEGTDDRQLKRALFSAKRLVADGPDKPFLDIHFRNAREGLAVGAYGLILATVDGGKRWMPLNYNMANSGERHLYSIAEANGYLYIAGEEGLLFRSQPGNDWHFDRLKTPYDGSFFTLSAAGEQLVAAGLKGNAFCSLDGGDSWQALDLLSDTSVVDSILSANGDLLLVNQAGQLLQGNVATAAVRVLPSRPVAAPTAVLRTGQNSLLLSGLRGLAQVLVPSVQVSSN